MELYVFNEVRGMLFRDFFQRNCINYYVFVYILSKNVANYTLSEMILHVLRRIREF